MKLAAHHLRIVVPRYGEDIIGGSETLIRRLAHALTERAWRISVWTTTAGDEATWSARYPVGSERDGGVLVRRFGVVARRRPAAFHQFSRALFRMPSLSRPETAWIAAQGPYAPHLVGALRNAQPVATLFTPYLFYPTLRGLPVAPHPRILFPAAHDERPLRLRAVGRVVAAADALWFNTPEERATLMAVHPVAERLPYAVGTTGIDVPPALDAAGFRRRHRIDGPYLLHGGRIATGKGTTDLITAVRRLRESRPDASLVLTGETGENTPSEPGIIPVGRLDDDECWNAIAGASAVVVPSFLESLSVLCLEAWACGRPAIVNGMSPVLRGQAQRSGAAIVYADAAADPTGLADAIQKVLDTPQYADDLGAAGRRFVAEHYTWDQVTARLSDLIDCARSAPPSPRSQSPPH